MRLASLHLSSNLDDNEPSDFLCQVLRSRALKRQGSKLSNTLLSTHLSVFLLHITLFPNFVLGDQYYCCFLKQHFVAVKLADSVAILVQIKVPRGTLPNPKIFDAAQALLLTIDNWLHLIFA